METQFINNLIRGSIEFLALGFAVLTIHFLFVNRKNLYKKKWVLVWKSESGKKYFAKSMTILLGLLLVLLSFAIVSTFLSFIPEGISTEENVGIKAVALFVIAGLTYSFSAFFDWLKYFSRVLICGVILFILYSVVF